MSDHEPIDNRERFVDRNVVLDLAGLSDGQREEGSILLGGSAAEYVEFGDNFDYGRVSTVVFNWGDRRAIDAFAALTEHREVSSGDSIPFSPVAVIDNTVWDLTLQDKDWRPPTRENKDSKPDREVEFDIVQAFYEHHIIVPFTDNHEELQEALSQMGPGGKEVIAEIGGRYVRFGLSMDVGPASGVESIEAALGIGSVAMEEVAEAVEVKNLSREQVLKSLDEFITSTDLEGLSDRLIHLFALHVTYWTAETFGTRYNEGDPHIYPDFEGGIDGENLPQPLKNLLMRLWQNEIRFGGENTIDLRTKHVGIETDPVIPRWDEIEQLPTFREQLDFIKANQDIIDGIEPPKIEVMPEVKMLFTPGQMDGWELEFTINPLGITVLPSGDTGKTEPALRFVLDTIHKPELLATISCQLASLAAKHADHNIRRSTQTLPDNVRDTLTRRLSGEEEIRLVVPSLEDIERNPGNAVKNLLIQRVLSNEE